MHTIIANKDSNSTVGQQWQYWQFIIRQLMLHKVVDTEKSNHSFRYGKSRAKQSRERPSAKSGTSGIFGQILHSSNADGLKGEGRDFSDFCLNSSTVLELIMYWMDYYVDYCRSVSTRMHWLVKIVNCFQSTARLLKSNINFSL